MGTVTVYLALCKVKYTVKMLSIGLVLAIGSLTGTLACENTTLPDGTTCPPSGEHLYVDPDHCSRYWECYNGCLNHITCKTTICLTLFMDGVISPPTFAVERGIVTVDLAMMNVVRAMTSSVHSLMDFLKILKTA